MRTTFASPLASLPLWRRLDAAERPVVEWFAANRGDDGIVAASSRLSKAAEHGILWYVLFAAGALVDRERRENWLQGGVAVSVSYVANSLLKWVLGRERPDTKAIDTRTKLSFPSSHGLTSFAAARIMKGLLPRPAAAAIYLLAGLTAGTRIHLAAHYPSDVAAGAAVGDLVGRATVARWPQPARTSG